MRLVKVAASDFLVFEIEESRSLWSYRPQSVFESTRIQNSLVCVAPKNSLTFAEQSVDLPVFCVVSNNRDRNFDNCLIYSFLLLSSGDVAVRERWRGSAEVEKGESFSPFGCCKSCRMIRSAIAFELSTVFNCWSGSSWISCDDNRFCVADGLFVHPARLRCFCGHSFDHEGLSLVETETLRCSSARCQQGPQMVHDRSVLTSDVLQCQWAAHHSRRLLWLLRHLCRRRKHESCGQEAAV